MVPAMHRKPPAMTLGHRAMRSFSSSTTIPPSGARSPESSSGPVLLYGGLEPTEARYLARVQEFALVTCDVNMPGGSGLSFVADLRARNQDIAVLMVSGMDDRQSRRPPQNSAPSATS